MTEFTENAFVCKLQELNSSQQSIQLCMWLIHHRKHHDIVVKTWFKELLKVNDGQHLKFIYLAYDVIQNSTNEGPEYTQEFGKVLLKAFLHIGKTGIKSMAKHSLYQMVNKWEEGMVYDTNKIQELRAAVDNSVVVVPEPAKMTTKRNHQSTASTSCCRCNGKMSAASDGPVKKSKVEINEARKPNQETSQNETTVEVNVQNETRTTQSPQTSSHGFPQFEQLIKALIDMEWNSSNDEAVRERMAALPPEFFEGQLLAKLDGKMTPYYRMNFIVKLVIRQFLLARLLEADRAIYGGPPPKLL